MLFSLSLSPSPGPEAGRKRKKSSSFRYRVVRGAFCVSLGWKTRRGVGVICILRNGDFLSDSIESSRAFAFVSEKKKTAARG